VKPMHLWIAAAVIVGALLYFGGGGKRYVGGISASSPKGAGGADASSALPRGYRSDAPNSPYTATAQ